MKSSALSRGRIARVPRAARVLDLHLGAELVHGEPFQKRRRALGLAIEKEAAFRVLRDEEVEEEFALGHQQRRIDGFAGLDGLDVIGDEPLQELAHIRAGKAQDAAFGQDRRFEAGFFGGGHGAPAQ